MHVSGRVCFHQYLNQHEKVQAGWMSALVSAVTHVV